MTRQKESKRTRQKKTREEHRKGELNDSREIPDRRRTSDISGIPSGGERERERERERFLSSRPFVPYINFIGAVLCTCD